MARDVEKNVTIVYNGISYYPSTIKFAPNNASWRIQLKGDAETGDESLSQYGKTDFAYFRFYTLEQIGKEFGISKMAISKRLRKILDLLRSLMEDEAPYFSQIFLETRFTNLLCVSYKVNHKHKKALRSHSVHALHLKNLDYSVIILLHT